MKYSRFIIIRIYFSWQHFFGNDDTVVFKTPPKRKCNQDLGFVRLIIFICLDYINRRT